ncbi:TIR domain-containing protein [Streptomyces anulatus]|uniref:TIR domain-containing protein n=1 Tax=Streptomyces anulatus TaxID=1892 RepID=UPI0037B19A0D|nr:toll/interleukin-1 receptor domain-containing protein [Streptomyces anulatus]WTE04840.1 toll/interleukin-1 receptor domain-containing protein [Streptomyces anulatus]
MSTKRGKVARIFINYSKKGGAYAAALLDELLSSHFGEDEIFRASRSIAPGSDYSESILECVAGCEVLLVIVDADWPKRFTFQPHDANPKEDWVSREIKEAFKHGKVVIPVLLSGAERLDESSLPEVVADVARLQYLRFDYRNIHQDVRFMYEQLVKVCPELKAV